MSDLHRTATFESEVEFQEDEIWAVTEHSKGTRNSFKVEEGFSSSSSSRRRSSNAWGSKSKTKRMTIPGSSVVVPPQQSSAPAEIPDWSKNLHLFDIIDDEGLPPHEYLAKRLARRQLAALSTCEGRGLSQQGLRN